jgi:PTH1 family peptidyl-tRNA hydrolase
MALAILADRMSARFTSHKTNSAVAEGRSNPGGPRLILAKPNSFMNLSGGPVSQLMRFYSLEPSQVIVVHDELDVMFGSIRLKSGGGPGGHNGVRDIISAVGTPDFTRVRIGVGRPPGRQDPADFVLRDFSAAERQILPNILVDAADAIEKIAADGLEAAQQIFHSPPPAPAS